MDDIFSDYFQYNSTKDIEGLSKTPAAIWQQLGEQKALENFQIIAKAVPAYKDFLKKHSINPEDIKTIEDFKKIPPTNKENYFKSYPLNDLLMGGNLHHSSVIHYSSGSSGKSFFWPKTKTQDLASYKGMEMLYKIYFDLGKVNNLFINCYGMGPWTAAEMVHSATKMMAEKDLKISIISPGTNQELFFEIFQGLADQFDQIIIGGYSSFLRDLVHEGVKRGIDFRRYKIKLLSGGEKYSENWRQFMTQHLGLKDPYKSVAAVLGSSEVGVGAISTPFVDYMRIFLASDEVAAQKLFKRSDLPSLVQYIPPARHIEIIDGNIVITSMGNIPLVRYDTKDSGQIYSVEEFLSAIPDSCKEDYLALKEDVGIPNLPILAIHGRADKTIILFGANIYPEQLTYIAELPELDKYLTGRFFAEKAETEDADVFFRLVLELKNGIVPSDQIKNEISTHLVKYLAEVNSEYAHILGSVGSKAKPKIELREYASDNFMSASGKNKV